MAFKNGLNRKEQVQCAQWLKEGIAASDIAKKFKTSVEVVNKFTQEKLDKATKAAKARSAAYSRQKADNAEKAAILKQTLDTEFK